MATYISGVTDYIPQFQPFQPDLNFYANVLQTKQNQYDTNYKALNNVYGQYFYADLTHGDNIKKKDELLKAIDFNLKRVSGLDLSLEQNVDQAQQVFKPFYEDKHLMKDMAWTKNTNSQRAYAAGLKNARDEKMRAQYWDAGIRAIDYKTEEFKNASLEETMNIGNINYTPYVNVMEKAQKIAKDAGLSVESVDMSPDGKWIVKTKNGEQLIPKLSHLFEATLGSDPAVMDVYKTQAYVNRKDYAYSNADQFGGDQNAAEMSYLTENYKILKAENDARLAKLQQNDQVYNNKSKDVEKAIETDSATPETKTYLERLQEARQINSTLLTSTENNANSLSERNGTATTSTGFENPYGDIESLRWKVDNAMASRLMQKDLTEAANVFAYKDAKQDITANPFAVQAIAHQYRMQEVASANASRERAARIKSDSEIGKQLVETGSHRWDMDPTSPTYKQAIPKEEASAITTRQITKGTSTDVVNLSDYAANQTSKNITSNVVPYMTSMLSSIRDLQKSGKLSSSDLKTIFGNTNMTVDKLNEQLKSDPYKLITKTLGTTKLKQITNGFQSVIKQNYNKGIKAFDEVGNRMSNFNTDLNDYYDYVSDLHSWRKGSREAVKDYVKETVDKDLKGYVKDMFDDNGNIVSEKVFNEKIKFKPGRGATQPTKIFIDEYGTYYDEVGNANARMKVSPYSQLKKAIHNAYGTINVKLKTPPPGLSSIGEFKDAGLTSINEQGITVYPDDYNSPGTLYFNSFKNNINNLDFENDVKVSFKGAVKDAPNRNKEGKLLLQEMFRETAEPGGKFKGFRLASIPLAENKVGRGAMVIYPDSEWLKKHIYTEKGEGDKKTRGPGIISQEQANYILRYGMTLISDEQNWDNALYKSTSATPFESHVNYSTGPVFVDDPNDDTGMNSMSFEKDDILGGYKYNFSYKFWNPNTEKYEKVTTDPISLSTGFDLEYARRDVAKSWANIEKINNDNFRSK